MKTKDIKNFIYRYFNISEEVVEKKTKLRNIVEIRQIAMYFARKKTKDNLNEIGFEIGKKNHATVLNALKVVDNLIATDKNFAKKIREIEKILPKSKIYIAGSIRKKIILKGYDFVYSEFEKVEKELIKEGFDVVNPMKCFTRDEQEIMDDYFFMSKLIPLLFECSQIVMLKGFGISYNAKIEMLIAKELGLKIRFRGLELEQRENEAIDYNLAQLKV